MEVVTRQALEAGQQYNQTPLAPAFFSSPIRRQYLQEMIKNLPSTVQNRITVLKNMQIEELKLEAEFFAEVYKLEQKYHLRFQPLLEKRMKIVSGEIDPPAEEPKWKIDPEDADDKYFKSETLIKMMQPYRELSPDVKGIPEFWLTVFYNAEMLLDLIEVHDEPALKKLKDIQVKYAEGSFTLEFHFEANPYFNNAVLTKQYFFKSTVDDKYPFNFDGPEIFKCKGCVIDWKDGGNLTMKTIRKKQKHKERNIVRTILRQIPIDSFFNFFDPPQMPEEKGIVDDEIIAMLSNDFEIGHYLLTRVIPRAILYYTGDFVDEAEEECEAEEDEEDYSSDDEIARYQAYKKRPRPNECRNQ